MKSGFLIKIIPPEGYSVYRLQLTRRHIAALGALVLATLLTAAGVHSYQLHAADADIAALQAQKIDQQRKLDAMDAQAQQLQTRYQKLQQQTDAIWRLLGADKKDAPPPARNGGQREPAVKTSKVSDLQWRLRRLARESARTSADAQRLQTLALRVLNLRRMASIARERTIAAIPSLNPVGGHIASTFGYRTDPFPEFHKGLDLAADYGTMVRAAAAGTVVSAGWEGGYGIKVDIDHGNGYHTWYCHLSRSDVPAGARVVKGQPIALVGSTGESTGPHLHYQVMHDGEPVDPMPFLNGVPPRVLATLPAAPGVQ